MAKKWLFKTDHMKMKSLVVEINEKWQKGGKASFAQVSVSMFRNNDETQTRGFKIIL